MSRRPPRSTRTDTLLPSTTLLRSLSVSMYPTRCRRWIPCISNARQILFRQFHPSVWYESVLPPSVLWVPLRLYARIRNHFLWGLISSHGACRGWDDNNRSPENRPSSNRISRDLDDYPE